MYSLGTNRDVRKLKWTHSVRSMSREILPVAVDGAASKEQDWDKVG